MGREGRLLIEGSGAFGESVADAIEVPVAEVRFGKAAADDNEAGIDVADLVAHGVTENLGLLFENAASHFVAALGVVAKLEGFLGDRRVLLVEWVVGVFRDWRG